MKLVFFTDTHVSGADAPLYGLNPSARLTALIDCLNINHPDAHLCVVGGDLTHEGDAPAFAAFRRCIERLHIPYRLLIGNHDDRVAFCRAFPEVPRDENGFVQSILDTERGRFLFLDTHQTGHSAGAYCGQRLEWLASALEENIDAPLFLFMHHPPVDIGSPWLDSIKLQSVEALRSVLAPHRRRIRHLFFGHVHRLIAGSWMGIPFSAVRGTNHQRARILNAEVDGQIINHGPVFYSVIRIEDNTVTVEYRDLVTGEPSRISRPAGTCVMLESPDSLAPAVFPSRRALLASNVPSDIGSIGC